MAHNRSVEDLYQRATELSVAKKSSETTKTDPPATAQETCHKKCPSTPPATPEKISFMKEASQTANTSQNVETSVLTFPEEHAQQGGSSTSPVNVLMLAATAAAAAEEAAASSAQGGNASLKDDERVEHV